MKRNITLYADQTSSPTEEFVSIYNIGDVVNYSVDAMFCDCLDSLQESDVSTYIQQILQKIRPNGYVHFKVIDIKALCLDVLQNKIQLANFVQIMAHKKNIVTLDIISTNIDFNKFEVTKLSNEHLYIDIVLKRII